MHRLLLSALAALLALAPHAGAQSRPQVARNADPNDWESYFALGQRLFLNSPREADEAFRWASRLDPTRAEPLLARWAAFYARDESLWVDYLNDDPGILRRDDVVRNEALLRTAYIRNPFVHRGMEAALLARLGERVWASRATEAFLDYGRGNFEDAARDFGLLVRRNPESNLRLRHYRALSFIGAGQVDSAAVEIQALLAALRAREQREVGTGYESKAMWEQALGLVYEIRGDTAASRRAYERSLEEDVTWYPARMGLYRLEERSGNAAAGVEQLRQAVEVAPEDGVLRLEYCNALLDARRPGDALQHCRASLELHPDWAEVYLRLGRAHDMLGQAEQAASMYREYLQRAPRRQASVIDAVNRRLAALAGR
jgi:tetratricopeptide (TPR) repeat protein